MKDLKEWAIIAGVIIAIFALVFCAVTKRETLARQEHARLTEKIKILEQRRERLEMRLEAIGRENQG